MRTLRIDRFVFGATVLADGVPGGIGGKPSVDFIFLKTEKSTSARVAVNDFAFVVLDDDTFDQSGDDGAVASLAVAEFPAFLQGVGSG